MPEYKLTYFSSRGFGELARLLFAMAEQPFEDIRVDFVIGQPAEIPSEIKKKAPYSQLPILEHGDFVLAQSLTIARYLARQFNLYGETPTETAKIDEILDAGKDFADNTRPLFTAKTEEGKKEAKDNTLNIYIPRFLGKFNEYLEKNKSGFLVGQSVSVADFAIYNYVGFIGPFSEIDLLKDYPAMKEWQKRIENIPQIKTWIEKRPKTPF